jgi:hypothetical protein
MGSHIELNDTLQITIQQGFPKALNINKHLKKPFKTSDFKGKVFKFNNKPNIRIFHSPPVRVFFAQNINGIWLYWGLVEITKLKLDMAKKTTSGEYKIVKIFTPEEMKNAEEILHNLNNKTYFRQNPQLLTSKLQFRSPCNFCFY